MDEIEYAGAFGGDFIEEGRRMARWTVNYMNTTEDVNVVILEGTTGAAAATDRTAGINEVLAQYPNYKVIASQTGNFTRAEGQAVMESFLKAHEDIDVLLAENDDMALGAIDAIKAAGKVPGKDIIIVGCDSVKAAFDAIVAGEMNATIECNPLYADAVAALIKKLEAAGFVFYEHGGSHDKYKRGKDIEIIPRHREINERTAKNILKKWNIT